MDWTEVFKVIGTIAASAITTFGGGYFILKKFYIERQDSKEEKGIQLQIDNAIEKAKKEMRQEIKESVQQGIIDCGVIGDKAIREVQDEFVRKLEEGLRARGAEGKERFDINSRQIEMNSKQLAENSKQLEELVGIVKDQTESNNKKFDTLADSLSSLNKVIEASAESQRSFNYDRILMVANKALQNGKITINQKTNLNQLYDSWTKLGGKDAKINTLFNECSKLTTIPDEAVVE